MATTAISPIITWKKIASAKAAAAMGGAVAAVAAVAAVTDPDVDALTRGRATTTTTTIMRSVGGGCHSSWPRNKDCFLYLSGWLR